MNERIEKLSIEANAQTGNEFDLNHKPLDAFLDKFAELIIKECCQFENSYGGDAGLVARSFSRKIKEHFGVEDV